MTVTSITSAAQTAPAARTPNSLGQAEFIRLMTTQMQMQDPLDPVDNKEMIAQMAQFSSLAGIDAVNQTLNGITVQLDRLIAAQSPAPTPSTAA